MTAASTPIFASRSASSAELDASGAERSGLREQPGREPLDRRGSERDDVGEREDGLGDVHGRERELDLKRAERHPAERSSRSRPIPTTTDGSARLALARSWSVRRPRNRPSPSASPIGRPITRATEVETSATRIVTHSRPMMYGLPCVISGIAPRI